MQSNIKWYQYGRVAVGNSKSKCRILVAISERESCKLSTTPVNNRQQPDALVRCPRSNFRIWLFIGPDVLLALVLSMED